MRKIVFISSGNLPIPAVNGGAMEQLVELLILENEVEKKFEFIVMSIYDSKIDKYYFLNSKIYQIKINKIIEKLTKFLNRLINKVNHDYDLYNMIFMSKVTKAISKLNVDMIIIENRPNNIQYLEKFKDIPIYLHMHNSINTFDISKTISNLSKYTKIIVVSDFLKNQICMRFSIDLDKVHVLKNCIDYKKFINSNGGNIRNQIRTFLGYDDSEIVFLFVGRLIPDKGVLELIKAFIQLESSAKLLIIGTSWYLNKRKSKFEELLVEVSSIKSSQIMFLGYIPQEELHKYYYAADVSVIPSVWQEPAGLVAIESSVCKLPIITTNSGGLGEYCLKSATIIVNNGEDLIDELKNALYILSERENVLNLKSKYSDIELNFDKKNYYHNFYMILKEEDIAI